MTIRFSNLVGQRGIYKTGSPNYIDVANTYNVAVDMVLFDTKATDDSWADEDTMGVRIYYGLEKYKVWYAKWRSSTKRLELITEEETAGTWADGDEADISLAVTGKMMDHSIWEPQFRVVSGTTGTITQADTGKIIVTTSGSATTLTIDDDVTYPFHCIIVQEGIGVATLARETTGTLNGATSSINVPAQFQSLHVYCRSAAATFIVVGA